MGDGGRLRLNHELAAHRGLLVWARPQRDVLVFDGEEVVGWHGDKQPASRAAFWRRCVGWDDDALDQVGPYKLVAGVNGRLALVGDGIVVPSDAQRLDWDITKFGPDLPVLGGLDSQSLSWRARLQDSPHGVVLCEPEFGLVWSLADGVAWQLRGVDESHEVTAYRVHNGVVIHSSWTERQGRVGWVSDAGEVRNHQRVDGPATPFLCVQEVLWTFLSLSNNTDVHVCSISTTDGSITPVLLLADTVSSAAVVGQDVYAVSWSGTTQRFAVRPDTWAEMEVLEVPRGGLERFNPAPTLGDAVAEWCGPSGPLNTQLEWVNTGGDHVGMRVEVICSGGVVVNSLHVADAVVSLEDGVGSFSHHLIESRASVHLTLKGRVAGPGQVRVSISGWKARDVSPGKSETDSVLRETFVLGTGHIAVTVDSVLMAFRGGERTPILPTWVSALAERGAMDSERPEPDLDRWMRRALRRCRVESSEQAPEAVHQAWLTLSERERTESTGTVPLYKLQSPRHWVVTDAECAGIIRTLGDTHAFSVLCAGGAFMVA